MSWPRTAGSSCARSSTSPSTTRALSGGSASLLASRSKSVSSTSSSANIPTARRAIYPPAPSTSTFVILWFFRLGLLHVPVEEGDDLLRVPAEVVVAVPEAGGGVLDPEELLVLAAQQVEGLLRVLGVPGPGIVEDLMHKYRLVTPSANSCGVISAAVQAPI